MRDDLLTHSIVIDQPAYDDNDQKTSGSAYGFAALSNMAGATPQNAKLNGKSANLSLMGFNERF